jgi:threonine/homoserine/homoserine lactone efflux protein
VSWGLYGTYLIFVVLLVLAPGPDTTVVLKNSLAGGRRAGIASLLGVSFGGAVQGTAAALGVGELITRSQPLFLTIRYIGAAYLCWLGIQAFRAARRGKGLDLESVPAEPGRGRVARWWLQGALSDLTNPKVLAMYLSVLPQFLARGRCCSPGPWSYSARSGNWSWWRWCTECATGSAPGGSAPPWTPPPAPPWSASA